MLNKIFERFVKKAPVAVMARGILERIVGPDSLNSIFEQANEGQYTRYLLFSSVFDLMSLVVCRIQPSLHAAYQDNKEKIETSVTSVYNKLNGIDIKTSRALVRQTAQQMDATVRALKGTRKPWLPATGSRYSMATASKRPSIGSNHYATPPRARCRENHWSSMSPSCRQATDVFLGKKTMRRNAHCSIRYCRRWWHAIY